MVNLKKKKKKKSGENKNKLIKMTLITMKMFKNSNLIERECTVIFIAISAWCQSSSIFQCNGFKK